MLPATLCNGYTHSYFKLQSGVNCETIVRNCTNMFITSAINDWSPFLLCTALAILLAVWYWSRSQFVRLINAIPGPKCLPFLGNLLDLNAGYDGNPLFLLFNQLCPIAIISFSFRAFQEIYLWLDSKVWRYVSHLVNILLSVCYYWVTGAVTGIR